MPKDILDELLNSDEDETQDEPDVDDGDEGDDEVQDEPNDEPEDKPDDRYVSLEAKLDELANEKKGLYKELKGERQKRQELTGRLEQLTGTIQQIINSRSEQSKEDGTTEKKTVKGIPVEFTEDGDALIPQDALASITKPYEEKIAALEKYLQTANHSQQKEKAADELINRLISEDDRYPDAYRAYQKARTWVNDRVIDWMEDNNLEGEMTSGQALDYVVDKDMEEEFSKRFPGLDIERVVTAEDSQRLFRRMLENVAGTFDDDQTNTNTKTDTRDESKVKKLMKKPSGLGSSSNAKAGDLSVIDKAADLTTDDIMGMSDKQIAELEKALLEEEKSGGIKF